jgi:hypothetical protein
LINLASGGVRKVQAGLCQRCVKFLRRRPRDTIAFGGWYQRYTKMATVAIRRRKLYEDVADHLDKLIQAGAYAPSDLLPSERDLMKHFGVGRPAVREALFHLREMGSSSFVLANAPG